MSYLPPRIRVRRNDLLGLGPQQALILADSAIREGRDHDAERLIEIVYERIEANISLDPTRH